MSAPAEDADRHREAFAELEAAGVTWIVVSSRTSHEAATLDFSSTPSARPYLLLTSPGGGNHLGWFEEHGGLDGTVAVITGGRRLGCGHRVRPGGRRRAPGRPGHHLAACAFSTLERALADEGRDALVRTGDARDPDVLAALFEAVDQRCGRLDTLVNVVGGTFRAPFADSTAKGRQALLRTNLLHVFEACALAIPRIRAAGRGGSIVNLTTIEAHRAAPGFAVYSAAKAAVEQFARTLAVELAPDGIRVNNVGSDYAPRPTWSRSRRATRSMSHPAGARVAIRWARLGRATDVSHCVVFLASGLSAFVTGTTLHPDGGTSPRGWFNWPDHGWSNHVPPSLLE